MQQALLLKTALLFLGSISCVVDGGWGSGVCGGFNVLCRGGVTPSRVAAECNAFGVGVFKKGGPGPEHVVAKSSRCFGRYYFGLRSILAVLV